MASARLNFIGKLKSKAQNSSHRSRTNNKDDICRDESPVPRELTAEELFFLEEIEDSDHETSSSFQITPLHLQRKTTQIPNTEAESHQLESFQETNTDENIPLEEYAEMCGPKPIFSDVQISHSPKSCSDQIECLPLTPLQQIAETRDTNLVTENDFNQELESEYENVLLHSANPTLGTESVPESPALLNNIDQNNVSYNSANLSPYITEQMLLLNDIPESAVPSPSLLTSSFITEQGNKSPMQSSSPEIVATKKRNVRSRIDKGRIRKVYKDRWLDVHRKTNRNAGKEYKSRDGKIRTERKLGPPCNQKCRLKCSINFNMTQRQNLFRSFWKLGDLVRQWEYINKYCVKNPKRRFTTETNSRRNHTIQYNLPKVDDGAEKTKVCKTMFLNTFDIKEGLVYSALSKLNDEGTVSVDARGTHKNYRKVITEEMKSSVYDHINSFAPIESHYVRSRSSKVYLDGSLSIARMYLFYQEWEDKQNREKVKTERQYRDILNENFNIGFYIPKKDQCEVCIEYQNTEKPAKKEEFQKYTDHLRNKTIAREMKSKDKNNAIINKTDTISAVYDFQKVHGIPYGEASTLYYKRKLTVFNFTVYDMGNSIGTCYVWDETTAKRGAIEVASCVYDFIATHSEKGIKSFHFYSDNCGGQNRNRIVFAAYMRAARDFQVTITHKYLEKGHTQNEGDSVHALIERSAKTKTIYTPSQWYAMIRWAKQDNKPYIVKEMDHTEFLDFKALLPNCNWTSDTQNNTVPWSKIRQLEIKPQNSESIYFKTDFCCHEYRCIVVQDAETKKKTRGRGKSKETVIIPMHTRRLQCAYETKLPITKAKKKDLLYLCQHKTIPLPYHNFYESLEEGEVVIDGEDFSPILLP